MDNVEKQERKRRQHNATRQQVTRQWTLGDLKKERKKTGKPCKTYSWRSGNIKKNISNCHELIYNWVLLLFLKKHPAQGSLDLILFKTVKKTTPNDVKRIYEHTTPLKTRPKVPKPTSTNKEPPWTHNDFDKILVLPMCL